MERRLAAILAADVVGYSRLMEADEEGIFADLKSLKEELLEPKIAEHHGRVFNTSGDGLLCEFGSAVDAVRCAVALQRAIENRRAKSGKDRLLRVRIGINLGDVIVEQDDLIGEGVNIASRLEAFAAPDGICISGTVRDHIAGKMDLPFADVGERALKNIERPVRLWHWPPDAVPDGVQAPLPHDKPSIAVLPFDNLSDDPQQAYFADGIAEDIIIELSRFRMLQVVARNSSFGYRGKFADVKQIARELGVQYVVEGSVRKADNRIRLNVELIDVDTGTPVWAEHYDRELEDVFAVQDEITESIVARIEPEFLTAEMQRVRRKQEKNLGAWDHVMRALWHLAHFTRQDVAKARHHAGQAIALDPNGATQFNVLAVTHALAAFYGWGESRDESLKKAREAAATALALNDRSAMSIRTSGLVSLYSGQHDDAVRAFTRAIALCPTEAENHALLGSALGLSGDYQAALNHVGKALRFSPRDVFRATWYSNLAMSASMTGRHEAGAEWARSAIRANPQFAGGYRSLAVSLGHSGDIEGAEAAISKLCELLPEISLAQVRETAPIKHAAHLDHYLEGLKKAGLRESR